MGEAGRARRLLILCYFYPPLAGGGVYRVLGFTRYLPRHGWNCTVICAGAEDYWMVDESLVPLIPEGTEVVRVPAGSRWTSWLKWRRGGAGRRPGKSFGRLRVASDWLLFPDAYAGWARRAARAADRLISRSGATSASAFDAVLSSSPPDSAHVAALGLTHRRRLPWIADFRDPWMGLWLRQPPTAWHRARHERLEARVLSEADLVLAASATHARALAERFSAAGADTGRVIHLPNGFEPESSSASAGPAQTPADARPDPDHFRLVFTGMLSLMPDTEVFFEALHDLLARRPEARRRLRVRLIGPYDSVYEDRSLALGLKGIVEFAGPRPHAESRRFQREADLLVLWKVRPAPAMVPGKLYEYLDAGRPIVAVLDSRDEAGALIERAGGSLTPPGNREALSREIERHYHAWSEGHPIRAARPDWLAEHTREQLAGTLAASLDRLPSRVS